MSPGIIVGFEARSPKPRSAASETRSTFAVRPHHALRMPGPSLCRELPMKTDRFDVYQHITDKIVNAIERGTGEFKLPWHRAPGSITRPVNVASKKAYCGINVVALWAYAEEFGYSSGTWGTFRQWSAAGAQVRKGEKAAFVVFYKELEVAADPETGDAGTATRLFARATPVFAAEQVSGFLPATIDAPPGTVIRPIEQAEAFVAATGASIHHGGGRAYYRPSTDSIHLPPREAFIGTPTSTPAESYFATLCHELCHWTCYIGLVESGGRDIEVNHAKFISAKFLGLMRDAGVDPEHFANGGGGAACLHLYDNLRPGQHRDRCQRRQ
jgi:antirestriction protein ArdC